jgi:hypothetical protein
MGQTFFVEDAVHDGLVGPESEVRQLLHLVRGLLFAVGEELLEDLALQETFLAAVFLKHGREEAAKFVRAQPYT